MRADCEIFRHEGYAHMSGTMWLIFQEKESSKSFLRRESYFFLLLWWIVIGVDQGMLIFSPVLQKVVLSSCITSFLSLINEIVMPSKRDFQLFMYSIVVKCMVVEARASMNRYQSS